MIRFVKITADGVYEDVSEEQLRQKQYTHIIITKGKYRDLKKKMLAEVHEKVRFDEENLNTNLNMIRIMRERANAERKLSPKKEHDGYLILSMQQTEWRFKLAGGKTETGTIWRSVVQTPYDVRLPFDSISSYIDEDLRLGGVLFDFGCNYILESTEKVNGLEDLLEEYEDQNILIKLLFRANCRSGLWEVELYTLKSLMINDNRIHQKK